jgi:hypothetical protein
MAPELRLGGVVRLRAALDGRPPRNHVCTTLSGLLILGPRFSDRIFESSGHFKSGDQSTKTACKPGHAGSCCTQMAFGRLCRDTHDSSLPRMSDNRIDFISAYCDRWCERCAYTDRCSAYACQVAAAMCGDFEQGLELSIGTPQPEVGEKPEPPDWLADFDNADPSAEELSAVMAAAAARDERIKALPLATLARRYFRSSFEWLRDRSDALRTTADPVIVEALDIVAHDAALIGTKIHRALHGRECREHDEDSVQNDWNGSAKVALISVDRSETAWYTIAAVSTDPVPMILTEQLAELRRLLIDAFPHAMAFVRPGFDEPRR